MLFAVILTEILETLIRQLGEMEFFFPIIDPDSNQVRKDSDRESLSTDSKITHAPLINLGCESELAKLDNRIKICGGTTLIQTISGKNVVTNNT